MTLLAPDGFAQRRRWRAFRDPSVEANYRQWHREQITSMARAMGLIVAAFWAIIPLSFEAVVGEHSHAMRIGNWAIAVPLITGAVALSYTRLRRWINEVNTLVVVVVGLDLIWIVSSMYGPVSGPVTCAAIAGLYVPLVIRLPTSFVAICTATVTTVPVALLVYGMRHVEISLFNGWFYVALLLTNAPLVLIMGALLEAGMRQQFAAQSKLQASQRLLRRYVPEQVADAVMSSTPDTVDRHERRKLTIFFSDLVGFTDLSEELEPEDLALVLHDYFTEMSGIARRHAGTVDDLVGDAILVFFGAPEFTDDHDQALRAVRMAVEMQEAMGPLNQRWASAGIPETLTVRMGINTGVATVGNFGSAERTKYTALGKQVNVAARIQSQCEPGKVLISHATWLLVRNDIACTPKGELELKGLHKPMPAYEVKP
jgi:class 3 adenylate cyclase